jgi:hypothetical protein
MSITWLAADKRRKRVAADCWRDRCRKNWLNVGPPDHLERDFIAAEEEVARDLEAQISTHADRQPFPSGSVFELPA